MKYTAVYFLLFIFLFLPISLHATNYSNITNDISTSANGGNSSVSVNINNSINSGSNSQSTSTSDTQVEIHQQGTGTSQVVINGEEWKVIGPGDISVREKGTLITSTPTPSPTISPVLGESDEISATPTPSLQENLTSQKSLSDMIQKLVTDFQLSLQRLFSKFTHIF